MATKAERFRAEMERANAAKHAEEARAHQPPPPDPAVTLLSKVKQIAAGPTSHNASKHAARKASYALEISETPKPSRKSTRASPNHIKPDAALKNRATMKAVSPKARASRPRGD